MIPGLDALKQQLNKDLNERGRILIRASGTEPLIRVMVEGEDADKIKEIATTLCEYIEKTCNETTT